MFLSLCRVRIKGNMYTTYNNHWTVSEDCIAIGRIHSLKIEIKCHFMRSYKHSHHFQVPSSNIEYYFLI